jgi:DNA repair protein RadC
MSNNSDGAAVYRTRIMDMPESSRPRERLLEVGPDNLSDAELIAILLRTGSQRGSAVALAEELLKQYKTLDRLAQATPAELSTQHGLGTAKAAQLLAALTLGKRMASTRRHGRLTITAPEQVAELLKAEMGLLEEEELRVILLNSRNHVLGVSDQYRGSVNSAQVRIGELFRDAIRANAVGVIFVHNHPSGDPSPSRDDIEMTGKAIAAGKDLDIDVLDHIVIAREGYVSMKERRLAFP